MHPFVVTSSYHTIYKNINNKEKARFHLKRPPGGPLRTGRQVGAHQARSLAPMSFRVNLAMSSAKLGIGASTVYGAENTARANPVEGETETTR